MDRNDPEELLGAYALDAVSDEERRLVEQYLETNPRAAAELQQHREVAALIAFTGSPAPDGLWARIAGELDERAPAPGPELARVLPMAGRRRPWVARTLSLAAAAAAAAIFAVVLVRATEPDSARNPIAQAIEDAREDRDSRVSALRSPDGTLEVEAIVDQDGHGYLVAGSLPALPPDRSYQLWGVIDDEVISLGVLGNNPENETFSADGSLTALAITEEVAGGVTSSNNPAVLAGDVA
jgi:anti-sigma factor RsiW